MGLIAITCTDSNDDALNSGELYNNPEAILHFSGECRFSLCDWNQTKRQQEITFPTNHDHDQRGAELSVSNSRPSPFLSSCGVP